MASYMLFDAEVNGVARLCLLAACRARFTSLSIKRVWKPPEYPREAGVPGIEEIGGLTRDDQEEPEEVLITL